MGGADTAAEAEAIGKAVREDTRDRIIPVLRNECVPSSVGQNVQMRTTSRSQTGQQSNPH